MAAGRIVLRSPPTFTPSSRMAWVLGVPPHRAGLDARRTQDLNEAHHNSPRLPGQKFSAVHRIGDASGVRRAWESWLQRQLQAHTVLGRLSTHTSEALDAPPIAVRYQSCSPLGSSLWPTRRSLAEGVLLGDKSAFYWAPASAFYWVEGHKHDRFESKQVPLPGKASSSSRRRMANMHRCSASHNYSNPAKAVPLRQVSAGAPPAP